MKPLLARLGERRVVVVDLFMAGPEWGKTTEGTPWAWVVDETGRLGYVPTSRLEVLRQAPDDWTPAALLTESPT